MNDGLRKMDSCSLKDARMSIINETISRLSESDSLDKVFAVLIQEAGAYTFASVLAIATYDSKNSLFVLKKVSGTFHSIEPDFSWEVQPKSLTEKIIKTGKATVFRSEELEATHNDMLKHEGIIRLIGIPLMLGQELFGLFFIGDRAEEKQPYSDDCLLVLETLCGLTSMAIRRLQMHGELSDLNEKMEHIIRHCPDIIVEIDKTGQCVRGSRGFLNICGYTEDELEGKNIVELYGSLEKSRFVNKLIYENSGFILNHRTSFLSSSGSEIPVLLSAMHLYDRDHNVVGSIGFSKDITNLLQIEEEREKYVLFLEEEIDRSNIANLASIAIMFVHDAKNTMMDIHGYITTIIDMVPKDRRQEEATKNMIRDLTKASDLMRLYFGRLFKRAKLKQENFKFNDIVKIIFDIVILFEQRMKKKDIVFSVYCGDKKVKKGDRHSFKIYCEKYQMDQLFLNLFLNSVWALNKKLEINKSFKPEITIKIDLQEADDKLGIVFRDNGIGIKEDDLPRIYNPFFTTRTDEEGGGGFGLTLAKYIVSDVHHGTIDQRSIFGEFCEFLITFPIDFRQVGST